MSIKWLDDKFANSLDNKMTLLIVLWILDTIVMLIMLWVMKLNINY